MNRPYSTERNGTGRRRWLPASPVIGRREVLRAGVGAAIGIALTGLVALWVSGGGWQAPGLPWLVAPMGASAVLLFAVPASPLAQPWPVAVSALLAATVAVSCGLWLGAGLAAGAVAVGVTVALMFPLRCVHPPAGALALLLALDGDVLGHGYGLVAFPVALNVLALLAVAILYHRLTGYRYPHWPASSPAAPRALSLGRDLDEALADYGEFLDISRDDLAVLYRKVAVNALDRELGETRCGDFMSRSPVAVFYGDYLEKVWALFTQHRFKAVPVVDRARRVIGIVTREDILRRAGVGVEATAERRVKRFVRRVRTVNARRPEVAGQVMSAPVVTLAEEDSLLDAVAMFSGHNHSHFPVLDGERRLVGMLARSDVLAALMTAFHHAVGGATTPPGDAVATGDQPA